MPLPARRSDDADVIRARLRRLLADAQRTPGWIPDDDLPPGSTAHARSRPAGTLADGEFHPDAADDEATHGAVYGDTADDEVGRGADDVPPEPSARPAGVGRHRTPGPTVRWSPGGSGARSLWLAGLGAALALLVWTWLDRPRVEPAPDPPPASEPAASVAPSPAVAVAEAPDTSTTVVVSVVGSVARPGLVTLPAGARVADAVEAAGGLLPDADPATINLAALVSDGEQIAVGVPGAPPAATGSAPDGPGGPGGPGRPVDLNTATVAELDALPGIGPVLAQRIVDHRTSVGPFTSAEELDDVPGIGPSIAAELADLVTV